MSTRSGRRRRLPFYLIYLLILVLGAAALWIFVPDEVKRVIRETYFSKP